MSKFISSDNKVVPLPDSEQSKKEQVAGMFNRIAKNYDFLNHFLSLGIDKSWRRKAIASIASLQPKQILDVATGTGDLAIAATKLNPEQIIGVDISEGMMSLGREKVKKLNLDQVISMQYADSENLPFADNSFDAITCAYGVRNFEHLEKGIKEFNRVLRPGGKIAILEFSTPSKFPVKQFYHFYFRYILPTLGKIVSKDQTAYTYLPESVKRFPEGERFCTLLEEAGFKDAGAKSLTLGITTLYSGTK